MKTETMNFEDFCATHGEISDKATGNKVALKLNGAQRHVVHYLEKCRVAGIPCRLLILKSRQLGISTVLQYYFTWLLLFHCEMETFLSLCHNKQLSLSFINSMMKIYTSYNKESKPKRTGENILEDAHGNHLLYGSARNYNAIRGYNIGIAHLSESAFWHSKTSDWSEEVIRSVMGSVGNRPGTFVVMESTSDGKNNYFYKLWRDSMAGIISYKPMFLSWKLCEYYSMPLESEQEQQEMKKLSEREQSLLATGYSLEQLNWYRHKRKEFKDENSFLREFPCTPEESFASSSSLVFNDEEINYYKQNVKNGRWVDFVRDSLGYTQCVTGISYMQWIDRQYLRRRYFVVVTIGCDESKKKYNVITCWQLRNNQVVELCLERRYLTEVDNVIDDSIEVAKYYNNAMLIVEVNNFDSLGFSLKEYYLRKLKQRYSRLFMQEGNVGYNVSHKRKLRGLLAFKRRLRDGEWLDYSLLMISEMENFVYDNEDVTAAVDSHDDVLLCRLILNDVLDEIGPLKPIITPTDII